MHFVVKDIILFHRAERAESYMQRYLGKADAFFYILHREILGLRPQPVHFSSDVNCICTVEHSYFQYF